jgi:hypothetical protein
VPPDDLDTTFPVISGGLLAAHDDVSRDAFERLVARAIELDESHTDRISLTKAREIARDLGISEAAWESAIAERRVPSARSEVLHRESSFRWQTVLIAATGFGAGVLGTWLNRSFSGDLDVIYGALLLVGGFAAWFRSRKYSEEQAHTALDAWWVSVPAGMLLAFGSLRTDPLLFAALARWGTGALVTRFPRLQKMFQETTIEHWANAS